MTKVIYKEKEMTEKQTNKEIQERVFKLLQQQAEKHIEVFKRLKDK